MADGNGKPAAVLVIPPVFRIIIEIIIVVFQTMLVVFGAQLRTDLTSFNVRLRVVELEQVKGDRWTLQQQVQHEGVIRDKLERLVVDVAQIKAAMGIKEERK